jgi:catechol 2,3-dioxygenase-like lactoylglutathione lyase family enzyme
MKGAALFVSGIVVGALLLQVGKAQDSRRRGINHIGISTSHYDEALKFYKDTLGAKEAFTVRNDAGGVRLTYLQLSRDTFVELLPAAAGQPTGITHVGIETGDVLGSVANLRAHGFKVDDPTTGVSKARVGRISDPDGVALEIMEIGPDSLQGKAVAAWKQ